MVDGTEQALAFGGGSRTFTPTHISHKQVEAYPLVRLDLDPNNERGLIAIVDDGGAHIPIKVPADITARGVPQSGSMLVRYAPEKAHPEGYLSFSPRGAFDAGYSPISASPAAGNMADAVSMLFATFRDELRKLGDSRELAVALTHLDTARLWAREHAAR